MRNGVEKKQMKTLELVETGVPANVPNGDIRERIRTLESALAELKGLVDAS